MAKRFELEMFGLDVIMRHDYETTGIKESINIYRSMSIKALTEFLTNVPGSDKFKSFLDIGCGDDHDIKLFRKFNEGYKHYMGIDLYMDVEEQYTTKDIDHIVADWNELDQYPGFEDIDVIFLNHSMEHAANVYQLMEQISKCQKKGSVLFVAVPDGNSPFGYSITSSTTHFSVITEGFLSTTLQRFGYNIAVEKREFREGSPELWAFAIRQ